MYIFSYTCLTKGIWWSLGTAESHLEGPRIGPSLDLLDIMCCVAAPVAGSHLTYVAVFPLILPTPIPPSYPFQYNCTLFLYGQFFRTKRSEQSLWEKHTC